MNVFEFIVNLLSIYFVRHLLSLIGDVLPAAYLSVHEISNNVVCATSKASDQPAHTRSLVRAFASGLSILLVSSY